MGSLFHRLFHHFRQALGARALPVGVFVVGVMLSVHGGMVRFGQADAQLATARRDAAKDYLFLLRHRLDLYTGASRDLAALFSASNAIEAREFSDFVKTSRVFERLEGIRAFGYLARVPAKDASRFEAAARRKVAGFRLVDPRPEAQEYFPMVYGQHAFDPGRVKSLLGRDFAAFPGRREAMQEAARRGEPVVTRGMPALLDPHRRAIVQVYSPVHVPGDRKAALKGFVFSTLYLDRMFLGFDNGRMARQFDLEVYDGKVSREGLLFASGREPQAPGHAGARIAAYRAEVRFANRTWLIHFHARPGPADMAAVRSAVQFGLGGILLSLFATWAVAAWPRYRARRRAIHDFNERFASFFDHHPFAVYAIDGQRRFLHANRQMLKELGVERHALLGTQADAYAGIEDRAEVAQHLDEALAGQAVAYTTRIADAAGRMVDMSIVLIPMSTGDDVTHVLGFAENITGRKEAERALYASRQMLQLILDNIPQSVFWKNTASVYEGGNRALLADAGLSGEAELVGKTDFDLHWRDQAPHYHQVDDEVMRSGLARMRMQALDRGVDGTERWIETSKIPLKDGAGNVTGVLAVTEDITARKYMEQELFRRAHHDTLTGLPNRGFFNSHLEQAVARAQRHGALALMYFDIDRFKGINDTHGHDVGDDVIHMFAGRVRAVVREADFVARLGGDEFVLVAEGLQGAQAAALIAQKIVAAMAPPFQLGTATLPVTTSIGIALFEPGMTSRTLIRAADQAMYDAKRSGRNCFRLAPSGQDRSAA